MQRYRVEGRDFEAFQEAKSPMEAIELVEAREGTLAHGILSATPVSLGLTEQPEPTFNEDPAWFARPEDAKDVHPWQEGLVEQLVQGPAAGLTEVTGRLVSVEAIALAAHRYVLQATTVVSGLDRAGAERGLAARLIQQLDYARRDLDAVLAIVEAARDREARGDA